MATAGSSSVTRGNGGGAGNDGYSGTSGGGGGGDAASTFRSPRAGGGLGRPNSSGQPAGIAELANAAREQMQQFFGRWGEQLCWGELAGS